MGYRFGDWSQFVDRAKRNGLSPTWHEKMDREMQMDGIWYEKLSNDTVVIHGGPNGSRELTRSMIISHINTIKNNHRTYPAEQIKQTELQKYRGALAALDGVLDES